MKYIVSEKHLKLLKEAGRVGYLRDAFGVFDPESEMEDVTKKRDVGTFIRNNTLIATIKQNRKGKKSVNVSEKVFTQLEDTDPTDNKMYLQWLLNMFAKFLLAGDEDGAWRFIDEDLGMIRSDLEMFYKITASNVKLDDEDRIIKALWKTKGLPKSINDYTAVSDMHAAIQQISDVDSSDMRSKIDAFVSLKEGIIAYEDNKWLVYIPKTRAASVKTVCGAASWCTQQAGNSYFDRYTKGEGSNVNQRRLPRTAAQLAANEPGNPSLLFIILNKGLFDGTSDELYQFHFESNQLHDKANRSIDYIGFLDKEPGLEKFFIGGLKKFASADAAAGASGMEANRYLKYLMALGGVDNIWEYLPKNADELHLEKMKVKKLDHLENAANTTTIFASNVGIVEIDHSIGELKKVEMLMLNDNNLTKIPKEIGQLKTLLILNIKGNNIQQLPMELSNLDEEKGGNLFRVICDDTIKNLDALKDLMPNVTFKHG